MNDARLVGDTAPAGAAEEQQVAGRQLAAVNGIAASACGASADANAMTQARTAAKRKRTGVEGIDRTGMYRAHRQMRRLT